MDGTPDQSGLLSLTTDPVLVVIYASTTDNYVTQYKPSLITLSATRAGYTLNGPGQIILGSYGAPGTFDTRLSEFIVYDRKLSGYDQFRVATYLSRKWGLSLPTAPSLLLFLQGSQAIVAGTPSWPDQSPHEVSGITLENGTAALDETNIAVSLDGSSDWVIPNLGSHNAFTVNVWYKDLGTSGETESPCILAEEYDTNPINYAILRGQGITTGMWACGFFLDNTWYLGPEFALTPSTWMNIQFTWDGSDVKTYINGSLLGTVNHSGATASSGGLPIRLGRRWDNPEYMTGLLGEVRIYSKALTDAEVLADYNESAPIFV
jgi:hypothetical protein